MDSRLRTGDEIVSVDGQTVIGCSHHKVVALMGQSALHGIVTLGVRRRLGGSNGINILKFSHSALIGRV